MPLTRRDGSWLEQQRPGDVPGAAVTHHPEGLSNLAVAPELVQRLEHQRRVRRRPALDQIDAATGTDLRLAACAAGAVVGGARGVAPTLGNGKGLAVESGTHSPQPR